MGSAYCKRHTPSIAIADATSTETDSLKKRNMGAGSRRKGMSDTGYLEQFASTPTIMWSVKECIKTSLSKGESATGCRHVFNATEDDKELAALAPFLYKIADKVLEDSRKSSSANRQKLAIDLQKVGYDLYGASLVVAPPTIAGKKSSNSWTLGPVHRDQENLTLESVYSIMIFLDKVTEENGTIKFWRGSQMVKVQPKNAPRSAEQAGLKTENCFGPEGNVAVWDARLLHQSLPNKTKCPRNTLHVFMARKDRVLSTDEKIFEGRTYKIERSK